MSIIEQAVRRLEELKRSGVDLGRATSDVAPVLASGSRAEVPSNARRFAEGDPAGSRQRTGLASPPTTQSPPAVERPRVAVDLGRLAAMGYVTPDDPRAQIANEFRVIKRPLLANVHGKSAAPVSKANMIMVTSSLPGEGKTFVAVNLAMSLAMELDNTVLLIDADVSRPSVLQRLGITPSRGLLDVLTDATLSIGDVILPTSVPKLSILPAGAPHGRATELLASDGMSALLGEIASRYADRILVFDAPPLLPSPESRVLASQVGQVVLVVESGQTHQRTLEQSLGMLEACPVVLPLLNKVTRGDAESYYGYYGPAAD